MENLTEGNFTAKAKKDGTYSVFNALGWFIGSIDLSKVFSYKHGINSVALDTNAHFTVRTEEALAVRSLISQVRAA